MAEDRMAELCARIWHELPGPSHKRQKVETVLDILEALTDRIECLERFQEACDAGEA